MKESPPISPKLNVTPNKDPPSPSSPARKSIPTSPRNRVRKEHRQNRHLEKRKGQSKTSSLPTETPRLQGTTIWYHVKQGFGFIRINETKEEVCVDRRDLVSWNRQHRLPSLQPGEPVEFVLGPRRQALKVTGPNGQMLKGSEYAKRRSKVSDRESTPKKADQKLLTATKQKDEPISPERHEKLLVQAIVHAESDTPQEIINDSHSENFPPLSPRGRTQRTNCSPY